MQFLVCAILALVVVCQAAPYLPGAGIYGGGRYVGRGVYGVGGGYGGGSEYGHSGFNGGHQGYLDEGYGSHGINEGHDIRHQENEFDSTVHSHQSLDHNIGGVSSGGRGGHLHSGQGGYQSGLNNYGGEFGHGYNNYGIL